MSLFAEYRHNPGKPELVLLHGWGMSSQVWGDFADELAAFFSLTLIDLPGLGRSQEFPEPYTTDTVLEQLDAVAPESASWLGWSMGGQLAISYAHRFSDKVEKLVTIASNPCFVQRQDWACATDEQTHQLFEQSLDRNVAKTLNRFIMLQTQGAEAAKDTLKMLKALLAETTHAAPVESLSLLREDVRPQLAALKQPVLQLFGDQDRLVPVAAAAGCEAITGQVGKIYAGAGHLPFYTHRQQVCDDLLAFLRG